MCIRRSLIILSTAILCSAHPAIANSVQYETESGARCSVTPQRPTHLDVETGYNEYREGYASARLSIPLGNETKGMARECFDIAQADQQQSKFRFLLELYETGVITRDSLAKEAALLGVELTPETENNIVNGFLVNVPKQQ